MEMEDENLRSGGGGGSPGLLMSAGQPQFVLLGYPGNLNVDSGDDPSPSWICPSKYSF